MGVGKNGEQMANYQPGFELHADRRYSRKVAMARSLRRCSKNTISAMASVRRRAVLVSRSFEIDPDKHHRGSVVHTIGCARFGHLRGSFLYHLEDNQVSVGFVIEPTTPIPISMIDEFRRFEPIRKSGPPSREVGGSRTRPRDQRRRVPVRAQTLIPGGVLIGCTAGFLTSPRSRAAIWR